MTARPTHASWRAHEAARRHIPTPLPRHEFHRPLITLAVTAMLVLGPSACGDDSAATTGDEATATLRIGAIPDQDPERLQRTYDLVAEMLTNSLSDELGTDVGVEYVPVTDYVAAVSGFEAGDLDLVWFGGLTGVQARLAVDGAAAIAQRDIDAAFTSVFVAGADTAIDPIDTVDELSVVAGRSLTFGSESSTSGRLMPQHFLTEAGIDVAADLRGEVGFSGSHDATIELVAAGAYDVGALNSQVWDSRVDEEAAATADVVEIFRTPTYYDYHWVVRPDVDERLGDGATDAIAKALFALDRDDPDDAEILELFGADAFVPTANDNYDAIESVARDIGLIR